jgi:hypothetical protein
MFRTPWCLNWDSFHRCSFSEMGNGFLVTTHPHQLKGSRRYLFSGYQTHSCRSEWPRGLRHELSPFAWTLGPWVRIPLKARCLCLFCVCVRQRPCNGLIPRPRSPTDRLRNWSETKRFTDALFSKLERPERNRKKTKTHYYVRGKALGRRLKLASSFSFSEKVQNICSYLHATCTFSWREA